VREVLRAGNGGWVEYENDQVFAWVRVGLAVDGRLEIRELHLTDEGALTTDMLRAVRLGAIEAGCNSPALRDSIIQRLDVVAPDFDPPARSRGRVLAPMPGLRSLRLSIPDDLKYPDSFYERLAALYGRLIADGEGGPAQAIADANGVAVSTVHRWIKEARRRHLLAPGRRGKAG
jgi:hypothetical protein